MTTRARSLVWKVMPKPGIANQRDAPLTLDPISKVSNSKPMVAPASTPTPSSPSRAPS